MERSGNAVTGASHHPDLADLMRRPGPFLTVWARDEALLTTLGASTSSARGSLPDAAVEDLADAIRQRFPEAAGVIGIADASGVLLVEALSQPPRRELARVDALPSLSPLIEHRQAAIPNLFVMIDRRGADVFWSTADAAGSLTVDAADDLVQKFKDGDSGAGYRQHDFQQKVENNWKRTASDVANTLSDVSARVGSRVITVAGDVRMIQLLRSHLPTDVESLLREVPGSRSEDGSGPSRDDAVRRWVRTAVAQDTVEILQVFERERGQHDRASDGADATFAALREARVDVLLVHDAADDERRAWYVRDDPTLVSLDADLVTTLGYEPDQAPLIDVAIRAALATSAGVRVVPNAGPVHEGLGAILRW